MESDTAVHLLNVRQVASRLHVSPETVRRWLRSGKMRGLRPGGGDANYRIRLSEVERFLDEGERQLVAAEETS